MRCGEFKDTVGCCLPTLDGPQKQNTPCQLLSCITDLAKLVATHCKLGCALDAEA